ncbi:MAG: AI-2E family transporter [Actinobacteria bacterium]|jgi:predicted PurR-regulated permease PerM|nr:AI-2E family transporter [Actinomycetota bacterium]NCW35045.1 AI-2E family transporter [Actinomycetota bacterium]NDA41867.1 AI-2E family transporter [Actinomycetota bacterium]NDB31661.1 AI-2E family transporter [Actinomycetota bacterium]NDC13265.1 AI-2E family transporter [Actinomycetota bacterium]
MARINRVLKKITEKSPAVSEKSNFGEKGAPLNIEHPFYFGFLAASGALIAITLLRALQSAGQVFVLLIIALFLAMGLNPAVIALENRRMKRGAAVATVVAAVLVVVTLAAFIVIPPVLKQVDEFLNGAPQLIDSLRNNATFARLNQEYGLIDSLQKKFQEYVTNGKLISGAFGGVLGVGKTVLSGAFSALTVMVLTLYFLSSLPSVTSIFYRLVPASRRPRVEKIGDAIIFQVGAFVGSQVLIALFASIFVAILGFALELPYAAALGVLILFVALIPLIGHFIGGSIVTLVALTQSPAKGALAILLYTAYVQIENYIITPRIMKRSLSIPGLVTITAALLGTSLLGLVGGVLAVPIAAAVLLIMNEVVFPKSDNS